MEKEKPLNYIKLITGEEILAQVDKKSSQFVRLNDPLIVKQWESDEGTDSTVLMNYLPFSRHGQCEISRRNILVITPVTDEVKRFYFHSRVTTAEYDRHMAEDMKEMNDHASAVLRESSEEGTKKPTHQANTTYIN